MLPRIRFRGRSLFLLPVALLCLLLCKQQATADAMVVYDFTGQITQQTGIDVGLGSSSQAPSFGGSFTYNVPGSTTTNLSATSRAYTQPNGNIYATVFGSDGTPYPMGLNYPTPNEPNAAVPLVTLNTASNTFNYTSQIANAADAWLNAQLPSGETVGPTKISITIPGVNGLDLSQLNQLALTNTAATLTIQGQVINGSTSTPFTLVGSLNSLTLDPTSSPVPVSGSGTTGGTTVNSPEPGTLAILSGSLVGLVFWRGKRRTQEERSAS